MAKGFFITGTDTGVGKTKISCALLRMFTEQGHKVIGMKPIAAGRENGIWQDVELLRTASNIPAAVSDMNPYAFDSPISPHLAAQQLGITIDLSVIERSYHRLSMQADMVIVEGVGGFLVPLNKTETGEDLAKMLGLPVILVVGMRLGCLNPALLTVKAIRAAKLNLAGWIANCIDPQMEAVTENIATLQQRLEAPLLNSVHFGKELDQSVMSDLTCWNKSLTEAE